MYCDYPWRSIPFAIRLGPVLFDKAFLFILFRNHVPVWANVQRAQSTLNCSGDTVQNYVQEEWCGGEW